MRKSSAGFLKILLDAHDQFSSRWLIIVNTRQPLADAWFPLYTTFFSPSPPPFDFFLVIIDRLWRDPELRASAGQSTGIMVVCASTNRSCRSNIRWLSEQYRARKIELTFVVFSNNLSISLVQCISIIFLIINWKKVIRVSQFFFKLSVCMNLYKFVHVIHFPFLLNFINLH